MTVLLLTALWLGIWAYAMPRSWYDTFPGFGLRWVAATGPYNEHFVKDIGGMYLALAVLTAGALMYAARGALVRVTATAWTVFNVLHLIYHVTMLQMYEGRDRFLVVASLVIVFLVSASLLMGSRRGLSPG